MYLSKIIVADAWSRNPYQLHRALWQLFPNRSDSQRDFLFRVENRYPGRGCDVLLQSMHAPLTSSAAQVIASKTVDYRISSGNRLRFRIRANPVRTIRDEQQRLDSHGEIKRCRVPLINEEEQQQWLLRKLSVAGRLESVRVEAELPLYFSKSGQSGKIQPVCFEGIIVATNVEALTQLLKQGIGPAKAMGCGLLSLAAA